MSVGPDDTAPGDPRDEPGRDLEPDAQGLVAWRPPIMLGPEREFELPAALVDVLEGLFAAAPLPADGGDVHIRQRAVRQATALVRLDEQRRARARALRRRVTADDGLVDASAERHHELADVARWAHENLRLNATWAVLDDDYGPCEPADVALAAGLTLHDVQALVHAERRRTA